MISTEESIPTRHSDAAIGQAIIWSPFNDISIFIEDTGKEYFYTVIFRKVFPDFRIEKIIPTGGKDKSISLSEALIDDKSNIFVVDLDFDEILDRKIPRKNLFYLDRYSIENFLLEEGALAEYAKECKPDLREIDIERFLGTIWRSYMGALKLLTRCYLLTQKYSLGVEYFNINPARDVGINISEFEPHHVEFSNYITKLSNAIRSKSVRRTLNGSLRQFAKHTRTKEQVLIACPGKVLASVAKHGLESRFRLSQSTFDSFVYRVAKNCNFASLNSLREAVRVYFHAAGTP